MLAFKDIAGADYEPSLTLTRKALRADEDQTFNV